VGERASGKAFGAETIRLMRRFTELLNQFCDLGFEFAYWVFGRCVGIAESGLIPAWEPCSWLVVVLRCRVTRQQGGVFLKDKH